MDQVVSHSRWPPIPTRSSKLSLPAGRLVALAMVCLVLSLFKYARRDPLSGDVGFQGPLEIVLIGGAFGLSVLTLLVQRRNLRLQLSSLCIMLFGLLALVSSVSSFFPVLSAVKAMLFLMLIGTMIFASSAIGPRRVLTQFYWALVGIILLGVIVSVVLPGRYPLLRSGAESGDWRTRLWIFETHPGVVADYVALGFLIGCVVRPRHWLLPQSFLLTVNLLCAGRTSTMLLLLCIGVIVLFLLPRRVYRTIIIVGSILGLLLLAALLVFGIPDFGQLSREPGSGKALARTLAELRSANGRTHMWDYAIDLLGNTRGLGYGFEGTRMLFLERTVWSSNAHSGYLDALLTAGIAGGTLLMFGWLLVLRGIARLPSRRDRVALLLINLYLAVTSVIGGQLVVVPGIGALILALIVLLHRDQKGPGRVVDDKRYSPVRDQRRSTGVGRRAYRGGSNG